jgi:hypothetical protein
MGKLPKQEPKQDGPVIDRLRALARLLARLAARKTRSPDHPEDESERRAEPREGKHKDNDR